MQVIQRRHWSTEQEIDYDNYKLNIKEFIFCIVGIVVIAGIFSNVFYKSYVAFVLMVLPVYFYLKLVKRFFLKKRREDLTIQFKDFCMSIVAQLSAGYSLENAMPEVYREMKQIYGERAYITTETKNIIFKLRLNINIEQCFEDLAKRSGIDEIVIFSEVIYIAKRNGGDMIGVVRDAANSIYHKLEVEREIKIIINSKKYEQMIMNIIPLGIVGYVRITCSGMLDIMYETILGRIIMSVCFVIYICAFCLGIKISNVEV